MRAFDKNLHACKKPDFLEAFTTKTIAPTMAYNVSSQDSTSPVPDIIHVMQVLGHKRIQNTLKYTQLVQLDDADAYVCKVADSEQEIKALVESGFQYVCENDGLKFFRKPK